MNLEAVDLVENEPKSAEKTLKNLEMMAWSPEGLHVFADWLTLPLNERKKAIVTRKVGSSQREIKQKVFKTLPPTEKQPYFTTGWRDYYHYGKDKESIKNDLDLDISLFETFYDDARNIRHINNYYDKRRMNSKE